MAKNQRQNQPRDRKPKFYVPDPPCTPKPPRVPPPPSPAKPFDKALPDPRKFFKASRRGRH
ncbi:MAG: hypothetical protein Q8N53_17790 [Longimicrobiales bacterium]|nr:hypothetical protein [Longimicrobiales bacterium]